MKEPWFLRGIRICDGWGKPQPSHIRFSSPGKGLIHHPARRRPGLVHWLAPKGKCAPVDGVPFLAIPWPFPKGTYAFGSRPSKTSLFANGAERNRKRSVQGFV
jgi:hypothetical protein